MWDHSPYEISTWSYKNNALFEATGMSQDTENQKNYLYILMKCETAAFKKEVLNPKPKETLPWFMA